MSRSIRKIVGVGSWAVVLLVLPSACHESVTTPGASQSDGASHDDRGPVASELRSGDEHPPVPTLPSAEIGTLPGAPGVDQDGNATYRVPLAVPPGPAGMQPDLALNYSSAAGNGAIGVGFSLSDLSSIHRCGRTIADDGAFAPIELANDDALCLDGVRLVVVSGTSGAAGARYRVRRETYAEVRGLGSIGSATSSFEVRQKDGRILTYGGTGDARVTKDGMVHTWALSRVSDRPGNFMTLTYASESIAFDDGELAYEAEVDHRIARIDYAGYRTIAPQRAVDFLYADKAADDSAVTWHQGIPTRHAKLLQGIRTTAPGGAIVSEYNFRYRNDGVSHRNLLERLNVCDAHARCLPDTVFEWELGSDGMTAVLDTSWWDAELFPPNAAVPGSPQRRVIMDVNGDGAQDLVFLESIAGPPNSEWRAWLSPGREEAHAVNWNIGLGVDAGGYVSYNAAGNPYVVPPPDFPAYAANFDDDGRDDMLLTRWTSGQPAGIECDWQPGIDCQTLFGVGGAISLMRSLDVGADGSPGVSFEEHVIDDNSTDWIYHALFPDLDGDGLNDALLCRGPDAENLTWVYALNVPSGAVPPLPGRTLDFTGGGVDTGVRCSVWDEYLTLDRDGDGTTDLLVVPAVDAAGVEIPDTARTHYEALEIDFATSSAALVDAGLPRDLLLRWRRYANGHIDGMAHPRASAGSGQDRVLDLNGDGLADILRFELAAGDTHAQIAAIKSPFVNPGSDPPEYEFPATEDVGIRAWINTGSGFARGDMVWTSQAPIDQIGVFGKSTPADWNGDGRMDLLLPQHPPGGLPLADTTTDVLVSFGDVFDLRPTGIPQLWEGMIEAAPRMIPVFDFRADGMHDVAILTTHFDLWESTAVHPDRLVGVTDGLQRFTGFDWTLTNDPEVYEPPEAADYPVSAYRGIRPIVRRLRLDNGRDDGSWYQEEHSYARGFFDRLGRGWLGFESTRTIQGPGGALGPVAHAVVDRDYGAATWHPNAPGDYPFAGMLLRERVQAPLTEPTPRTHVSRTEVAYDVVPNAVDPSIYATHATYVWDETYEHAGCTEAVLDAMVCDETTLSSLIPELWTETSILKDQYGSDLEVTRTYNGGWAETVETTYVNVTSTWLLGLPDLVTVTSADGLGVTETRTTDPQFSTATGLLNSVTVEPGNPDFELTTTFTRNSRGNVTATSTEDAFAEARTTATAWDTEGVFPLTATNELGQVDVFAFDPGIGVPISWLDPGGVAYEWRYDGFGRLVREIRHDGLGGPVDGAALTITYSEVDDGGGDYHLRVQTKRSGGEDVFVDYDRLQRPVETTWAAHSSMQSRVLTEYDAFLRPWAESVPAFVGDPVPGWTTTQYDRLDRPVVVVNPEPNSQRSYEYELLVGSSVVRETDEDGHTTELRFDAKGRPSGSADGAQVETCFEYGTFDALEETVRDCGPGGSPSSPTIEEYDLYGRRTVITEPSAGTREFHYDAWGELELEIDALGDETELEYDALGRLTDRIDIDGTTSWVWDTVMPGRLSSSTTPSGVARAYEYDGFGRVKHVDTTAVFETYGIGLSYDSYSRISEVAYPMAGTSSGITARYEYDGAGHLLSVSNAVTTAAYWTMDEADASGRVREETFGNGLVTARGYDELSGRLTSILTAGASPIQNLGYVWSPGGDLEERHDGIHGQHEINTYNSRHQLVHSQTQNAGGSIGNTAVYDDLGNLTFRTDVGIYGYVDERLTSAAGQSFGYDANGRLRVRDGTDWFSYTGQHLLSRINLPGDDVIGIQYDADGSRVVRTSTEDDTQTITIDGLYERVKEGPGGTGQIEHRYYIYADGRAVAQVLKTNTVPVETSVRYVHGDVLGSTDVITNAAGVVLQRRSYDAFGRGRDPTDWTISGTFADAVGVNLGYTGHRATPDAGLVPMGARMFDPSIGRFTTPDPIVAFPLDVQGHNRYAYVLNNPLGYVDPTGFSPEDLIRESKTPEYEQGIHLVDPNPIEITPTAAEPGAADGNPGVPGDAGPATPASPDGDSSWSWSGLADKLYQSSPTMRFTTWAAGWYANEVGERAGGYISLGAAAWDDPWGTGKQVALSTVESIEEDARAVVSTPGRMADAPDLGTALAEHAKGGLAAYGLAANGVGGGVATSTAKRLLSRLPGKYGGTGSLRGAGKMDAGRAPRGPARAKMFEKAGIKTTTHFRNRLAQRGSRGITEKDALDAYRHGRLFYNPETKNYIRHSSRTGVSVVTDAPSGGTAITVFEGNPSPTWQHVPWRPGE